MIYTIDTLYEELAKARKAGLGSKKILLSADDEGNEFHPMFYGITTNMDEMFGGVYPPFVHSVDTDEAIKDYVILG